MVLAKRLQLATSAVVLKTKSHNKIALKSTILFFEQFTIEAKSSW